VHVASKAQQVRYLPPVRHARTSEPHLNRPLLFAALPVIAFSLACGGMSKDIASGSFVKQTVQLGAVADGTEKIEVAKLLDDGWLGAQDGDVGFTETMSWDINFSEAIEDGIITNAELIELRGDASDWVTTTPAPDRDTRLAAKRQQETEKAVEMAASAAADFSKWKGQEGLKQRMTDIGWSVSSCSEFKTEDYANTASCDGVKGALSGSVELVNYDQFDDAHDMVDGWTPGIARKRDGRTVLTTVVTSGEQSGALLDKLVPKGTKLKDKDMAWLKSQIKAAGYSANDCEFEKDAEYIDNDCDVLKGPSSGFVSLSIEVGRPSGKESRSVEDGSAMIKQGGATFSVTLYDDAASKQLITELTTPKPVAGAPAAVVP